MPCCLVSTVLLSNQCLPLFNTARGDRGILGAPPGKEAHFKWMTYSNGAPEGQYKMPHHVNPHTQLLGDQKGQKLGTWILRCRSEATLSTAKVEETVLVG